MVVVGSVVVPFEVVVVVGSVVVTFEVVVVVGSVVVTFEVVVSVELTDIGIRSFGDALFCLQIPDCDVLNGFQNMMQND